MALIAKSGADLTVADFPNPDECANQIVQSLQVKGFCIIDAGADDEQCTDALEEVRQLQASFRFKPPPEEVLDGALGLEGSAQICHFTEDIEKQCSQLKKFDKLATDVGRLLDTEIMALGFELSRRSVAILHETGKWDSKAAPPMTESDAEYWLNNLVWHKLMALQFLGPGETSLELAYLDTEFRGDVYKFDVSIGSLVLLRPDLLSHKVSGAPGNITMTCWFLPPHRKAAVRGGTLPTLTPAAERIDNWAMERLHELANAPASYEPGVEIRQFRVMQPAAFKLDAPRELTKGGERLEIAKKGEVLYGTVVIVDGLRWLKCATHVVDDYGRARAGYVIIDGDLVGQGKIIEEVLDLSADWMIAKQHVYTHSSPVAVRSASCMFAAGENIEAFYQPFAANPDFSIEVPMIRWNHSNAYNPPEWEIRQSCTMKHGAFMDGVELFDGKRFGISVAEATSMDPQHRLGLEMAEEAFMRAGLKREQLMRSVTGVYVAGDTAEWNWVEKLYDASADMYGCTGSSGAIQANRVSFNLGLMGPSIVFAAEGASSLLAIERGYISFAPSKPANIRCICLGLSLMLSPYTWVAMGWQGVMWNGDYHGRCKSFEQGAHGFTRGDGIACCCMTPLLDTVDGEKVRDESLPELGLVTGAMLLYHGQGVGFNAPHGPAEQRLVAETLRLSELDAVAVDGIETNGEGRILQDAVEATSLAKALRGEHYKDVPLPLTCAKANQGHCVEATGLCSFLRVLMSARWGVITPFCHLGIINPHIDVDETSMQFVTEIMPFRMRESIPAVRNANVTGTMAMCTLACTVNDERVPLSVPLQREHQVQQIAFWPGGGGTLDDKARPRRGYELAGTWDNWKGGIPMELEGERGEEKTFIGIITLGVNRFEEFQILIDGDSRKALHPGQRQAPQNIPVCGPDAVGAQFTWLIDGRSPVWSSDVSKPEPDLVDSGANEQSLVSVEQQRVSPWKNSLTGKPGDRYAVQLHIAGRWRVVTWSKFDDKGGTPPVGEGTVDDGQYFCVASWNDWSLEQEMARVEETGLPGDCCLETKLAAGSGEFQVVRNRDFNQAFFPEIPGVKEGGPALGPGDYAHGQGWWIDGAPGDVFRIYFRRNCELETCKVSWEWLRNETVLPHEKQEMLWPRYYVVGTLDFGPEGKMKMLWDEGQECYTARVDIGPSGQESFQLLVNGDWASVIYPITPGANSSAFVMGPAPYTGENHWTIGVHEVDRGAENSTYEVLLKVGQFMHVTWRRV